LAVFFVFSAFSSITQAQSCGSGGGATVCLTATGSSSNISLSWTVTGTITAIEVYRDTDSNPTGRVRLASLATSTRSYTDRTAVAGTPYWFWIKFRASGTQFNSNAATATRSGGGGGGGGAPVGFGRSATGGAGGAVVTAHTGTEINAALCGRASVSTPLIIRVDGTINHGNTTRVTGSCDTTATEIQFKGVSNVTLVGVSNRGVLDQIGVHLRNTSNIVIQNLWIRNVKKSGSPISNGGDSIGMESSVNNVWVDHNTLEASGGESSGFDSLLDMKAGVTNITVSWNHYRNSSRAGLIGSSDDDDANTNITFHHNWYENIEQRTPLLRHGLVHTYNNYWSNLSNSDMIHGINSRMNGRVLVEGNYFKNSNNPLLASDDSPQPGCWQTRSNTLDSISYSRSVGNGALVIPVITNGQFDSTCTVTVPYSYALDPSANIPSIVSNGSGHGKISP